MATVHTSMRIPGTQEVVNYSYTQSESKPINVISAIAIGIISALAGSNISRYNPALEFVFYVMSFSSICFAIYHLIPKRPDYGSNTNYSSPSYSSYNTNGYGYSGGHTNYSSRYTSYSSTYNNDDGYSSYSSGGNTSPSGNNGWTEFPTDDSSGSNSSSSDSSSSGGWSDFDD